jgi:hypothetical protein
LAIDNWQIIPRTLPRPGDVKFLYKTVIASKNCLWQWEKRVAAPWLLPKGIRKLSIMGVINKLASSTGRRDEVPNQALAAEIAAIMIKKRCRNWWIT